MFSIKLLIQFFLFWLNISDIKLITLQQKCPTWILQQIIKIHITLMTMHGCLITALKKYRKSALTVILNLSDTVNVCKRGRRRVEVICCII